MAAADLLDHAALDSALNCIFRVIADTIPR
jgi:hypothetical protein